jgi:hypothetical protein
MTAAGKASQYRRVQHEGATLRALGLIQKSTKADNNGRRCGKPIVSYRLRLIGILGFPRRTRWRDPFTAAIFRRERRQLGAAP